MGPPGSGRARPLTRGWLVLCVLLFLLPRPGAGQIPDTVPAPPDTVPEDTVLVPIPPGEVSPDTIPEALREAAAAPTPALLLPLFPRFDGVGWDVGRWEWSADQLARVSGMSVLEFIEHLPGMVAYRAGGFGRPEGLTALGMGGARLRVFLDGYELDPHSAGAYPLETIAIIDLRGIRVERSLSEIRVEIETFVLDEPEPASAVALGTGVYQTRLLRGLFSRGFGTRSVGTAVFDLASTGGIGIAERYRHSNAAVRWNYARSDRFGMQVEWRRTIADRQGTDFPQQTTRGDLIFRARATPLERVTLEAFLGRSGTEEDLDVTAPAEVGTTQAGARMAIAGERVMAEFSARGRLGSATDLGAPRFETEARAALRPAPALRLEGAATFATAASVSATSARVTGSLHPAPVLSIFATAELGSKLVPMLVQVAGSDEGEDPVHGFTRLSVDAGGLRSGVELGGARGAIGLAGFRSRGTELVPFGLPFDRGWGLQAVDGISGVETYFRIPFPGTAGAVHLDGWYSRFAERPDRMYTPEDIGRLGIAYHGVYIGGQLEPSMRIEGVRRGWSNVPGAEPGTLQAVAPFQSLNFSLQLRIIDVTAFLIWDNMLGQRDAVTLPGAPPASPRIVYGGSWRFTN